MTNVCDQIRHVTDIWNPEYIIRRLEEAGKTLLAMHGGERDLGMQMMRWEIVRDPRKDYPGSTRMRAAIPDADQITAMDEAFGWVHVIPLDMMAKRRVVWCRAMVDPISDAYRFSWRRIGEMMSMDHKRVQRMHAEAIDIIFKKGASQTPHKSL